jgi:hypothetical protein
MVKWCDHAYNGLGGIEHGQSPGSHQHRSRGLRRQALHQGDTHLGSLVLDLLATGMSEAELRAEYPALTHEDVLAAIAYGAEAARERIIPVPVEPAA